MLYKNYEINIIKGKYSWYADIYDGENWYWREGRGCTPKHTYDLAKSIIELYEKYPSYYPSM